MVNVPEKEATCHHDLMSSLAPCILDLASSAPRVLIKDLDTH